MVSLVAARGLLKAIGAVRRWLNAGVTAPSKREKPIDGAAACLGGTASKSAIHGAQTWNIGLGNVATAHQDAHTLVMRINRVRLVV
jgi:hypothetical protein